MSATHPDTHDPSRREALVGLVGLVTAGPEAEGPPLFLVPGEGAAAGWSDFARHRAAGTAAGMDFDAAVGSLVHPMAEGTVVLSTFDRISGHVVVLDHGLYQTRYAHLEQRLVNAGEHMPRTRPLGRAGASGLGAWLGPHLHVDLHTEASALAFSPLPEDEVSVTGSLAWIDPIRFAAGVAFDRFGNVTLPWAGEDVAERDAEHRLAERIAARRVRACLGRASLPDPDPTFPSGATPAERRFRARARALFARSDLSASAADALRAWVAVRPALTAPLARAQRT